MNTPRERIQHLVELGKTVWRHDAMLPNTYHVIDMPFTPDQKATIERFGNTGVVFANTDLDAFMLVFNGQSDTYSISPAFDEAFAVHWRGRGLYGGEGAFPIPTFSQFEGVWQPAGSQFECSMFGKRQRVIRMVCTFADGRRWDEEIPLQFIYRNGKSLAE